MSTATETIEGFVKQEYKYGFRHRLEADSAPPGLNEDIIRLISKKKNEPEFMLEWRLKAFRHWQTMTEPTLEKAPLSAIDFQKIIYYSAPRSAGTGQRAWTKSIRSCSKRTRSWAFR